ncbi:MAG: C40 family peptidase [Roseibium sp.]|nr:C40 family peptidase [Roseibium sp.]
MAARLLADPGADRRAAIVAEARTWLGTPYRHQASLKGTGCDCLGLVRGIWRAFHGAEPQALPPYSADWAEADGEETLLKAGRRWLIEGDVEAAKPGDVVVFRWKDGTPAKHAGILSSPARLIHAYERVGVVETALVPAWRRRIAAAFSFPKGP